MDGVIQNGGNPPAYHVAVQPWIGGKTPCPWGFRFCQTITGARCLCFLKTPDDLQGNVRVRISVNKPGNKLMIRVCTAVDGTDREKAGRLRDMLRDELINSDDKLAVVKGISDEGQRLQDIKGIVRDSLEKIHDSECKLNNVERKFFSF